MRWEHLHLRCRIQWSSRDVWAILSAWLFLLRRVFDHVCLKYWTRAADRVFLSFFLGKDGLHSQTRQEMTPLLFPHLHCLVVLSRLNLTNHKQTQTQTLSRTSPLRRSVKKKKYLRIFYQFKSMLFHLKYVMIKLSHFKRQLITSTHLLYSVTRRLK